MKELALWFAGERVPNEIAEGGGLQPMDLTGRDDRANLLFFRREEVKELLRLAIQAKDEKGSEAKSHSLPDEAVQAAYDFLKHGRYL